MLTSLINRQFDVDGWHKIPWNDPAFSARMLREHLSQDHDAASRRAHLIDQQVAWIQRKVLKGKPARILDLGCGPGFYMDRLVELGHTCTGLDFSPASIEYARQHHRGEYQLADLRTADFEKKVYDLVMVIYGELNAFAPADAQSIIDRAYDALMPGGQLLLEVHDFGFIESLGHEPPSWHAVQSGLFSDQPYVCLTENRFEDDRALHIHHVIDAQTGALTQYLHMHQAYTDDEYRAMLGQFGAVMFYPSLTGETSDNHLFAIVATK